MLAGSRELIEEAWRYKQMWARPCARPASWRRRACALDHHVERLAEDHENARVLAEGWPRSTVELDPSVVETNIVVFGVRDAAAFCAASLEGG